MNDAQTNLIAKVRAMHNYLCLVVNSAELEIEEIALQATSPVPMYDFFPKLVTVDEELSDIFSRNLRKIPVPDEYAELVHCIKVDQQINSESRLTWTRKDAVEKAKTKIQVIKTQLQQLARAIESHDLTEIFIQHADFSTV